MGNRLFKNPSFNFYARPFIPFYSLSNTNLHFYDLIFQMHRNQWETVYVYGFPVGTSYHTSGISLKLNKQILCPYFCILKFMPIRNKGI